MLDIERHDHLLTYLRDTDRVGSGESPCFETLAGGVSCRTVLVVRSDGPDLVLKQALEFLRVEEVWRGDPARVSREAEAMRALDELLEPDQVPQLIFEDPEVHLIAMTAVPWPHENWKTMLLRGDIDSSVVEEFAAILGAIHRGSSQRHDEMSRRFADRTQFETLRVDPYYRFTAERVPEVSPWIEELIDDAAGAREALVHGDFSPKNVLVRDRSCVLLDHEVAHWGDPAFDIGFASAHFLGKANHLGDHREAFGDVARLFWRTYRRSVEDLPWFPAMARRAVRHAIGCTLARVSGKSPLEYLTASEQARQRSAAIALSGDEPADYDELVDRFLRSIAS